MHLYIIYSLLPTYCYEISKWAFRMWHFCLPGLFLKIVFRHMQGGAPGKRVCSNKFTFLVEFDGNDKTVTKLRHIWPPSVFVDITEYKAVLFVSHGVI